jgi:hypothetical protein
VKLSNGEINTFEFNLLNKDSFSGGYSLRKNGVVITEGHLNGGTWVDIPATVIFAGEIVFEYVDYPPWDESGMPKIFNSIIVTSEDRAIDIAKDLGYEMAFSPFGVQDNLVYLASRDDKTYLVFDGKEVGNYFDSVFNQCFCWDGPQIQPVSNGEIYDFFARRDNGWYHVQAGNPDAFDDES